MKSLVLKIYAFKFFSDFMLIYPLYAVMFVDHGLSTGQIASILMVWSAVVLILEVPSGALADRVSRRRLLAFSQLIRALGFASWLFFPTYWGFFAGFVLWGVRSALTSGTLEALVFDELKQMGEEGVYGRIAGRGMAVSFAAIVLASGGAALAAEQGYAFILICSIVSVIVSAIIPLTLPDAARSERQSSEQPWKDYTQTLKSGLHTALTKRAVLSIVAFGSFSAGALGMLDEFWPIFVNMVGASNAGVAIFMAIMSALQGITSTFAHNLEHVRQKTFFLLVALGGLILVLASAILEVWALGLIMVVAAFDPVVRIVFGAKLQHEIASETRATVTSAMGFSTEMVAILSAGAFGIIAEATDTQMSFIVVGGLIAAIALGFYWQRSRRW